MSFPRRRCSAGTVRTFSDEVARDDPPPHARHRRRDRRRPIEVEIEVDLRNIFSVLENDEAEAAAYADAAREIVGDAQCADRHPSR